MEINPQNYKVIIWGHPIHSHTHSYIHHAFYRAFTAIGYKTFWLNDGENINNFDFSNSLFLTEGQVDKKIPLKDDCLYVLHNCATEKYQDLFNKNRCMRLGVYCDDILKYNMDKKEECIYYDLSGACLHMPWATDLLPHEIEINKPNASFNKNSKIINWVGTYGPGIYGNINQIDPFKLAAREQNISFYHDMRCKSLEENIQLIKNSYMAPAIVGGWQHKAGYVPCRIFKNISYGQFGITNSPRVYELFDHKIIHNNDTRQLFINAKQYLEQMSLQELHSLMDVVKEKHTYLNRIQHIINFLSIIMKG